MDPDAPPPSATSQARDVAAFGLLMVIPLACALVGRWTGSVLSTALAGRVDGHQPTT